MRTTLVLLLLCFLAIASARFSYEGYKVYEIKPKNEVDVKLLDVLGENQDLDFWTKKNAVGKATHVLVKPDDQKQIEALLKFHHLSHSVLIENVEKSVETETQQYLEKRHLPAGRISFNQYLRHAEINAYLKQLSRDYPNIVSTEIIGKSTENRDLTVIRISTGNPTKRIVVDGGIHAREWISPATALYIINQLVENSDNLDLSKNIEWIILPSVNPDGYEYTWDVDRFWRKTRSHGSKCYGVDPNRNFEFHWMESGASSNPCSDTYGGPEAFSEPETRALRNYILSLKDVKLYLTLHSYGPYMLYPWGYDDSLPSNWRELDDLGNAVAKAIQSVDRTEIYEVGSSTRVLYAAAGASDDWAMGVAGINLVYTMELPGGGSAGFDLPPNQILRVVTATWEGIKVLQQYVETSTK